MKKILYDIDLTSYINSLVIVEMYDRALFKGKLINITKDLITLHDDADILIPISTILNIYVIDWYAKFTKCIMRNIFKFLEVYYEKY